MGMNWQLFLFGEPLSLWLKICHRKKYVIRKCLALFCLQICSLLWPEDYGELVSSHGSTTPENNDIILWRMRREYEFEPQARLRQHTSRALHLALSPDKTTVGEYHLSRVTTKPVFWVSDQARHKPDCTVTEEAWNFGFSRKRVCSIYVQKTKALICAFVSSPEPKARR